ncbi:anhydro-N-acetylmuramic acid kinase [Maritimibacter fusiformis]|uniref:Anhydro-N-acetylmuramic acid kinase n=1 Tax=Maritimibacter fusiformis TaxID=2603819 RepID=A0A5D0RJX6_9RHOB|nr:anhydro-N-acetylmuramic acid kinase [Maritimibacter fusiformis]TYB81792.1 anhydro-N-acetylmuramic acid kinase [Maritimibacter fusiformis]
MLKPRRGAGAGQRAGSGPVWALGAVAGARGVTAAMLLTDGARILEFGEMAQRTYSPTARAALDAARGCWPDAPEVEAAARHVEAAVAEALRPFPETEVIGFQGPVLAHDPGGRGRHLAGDGGRIASALSRPVAWDFHSSDAALGGAGAPLGAFFHFALGKWLGADAPFALVSFGDMASLTWIDPRQPAPETPGALLAFETGPGPDHGPDAGTPDTALVETLLELGHFARMPPKTLPAQELAQIEAALEGLTPPDAAATRSALAVAAVARGLEHCPTRPARLLIAGGGRQGTALAQNLAAATGLAVEALDSDGAGIEAQAMAYLAMRTLHGLPTSCPATTGVAAAVGGGLISSP